MTTCKEFLDDAISVTAIPITDYNLSTLTWQLMPAIPSDQFSPNLDHAVTIGLQAATNAGTLIPIVRATGKVKDDESDSVADRLHTVTVNCQVDDRELSVWDRLLTLERTPSHLILTFRDKTRAFVAATEDAYLCTVDRDGAKTSVQFRIQNYLGVQMLV